jgi:hypothetical protein
MANTQLHFCIKDFELPTEGRDWNRSIVGRGLPQQTQESALK